MLFMHSFIARSRHAIAVSAIGLLCLVFVCRVSPVLAAQASEKYVFILPALGNPYWQIMKQGIEERGKTAGVNVRVLTAANDLAKEEHLNLCQTAIAEKPAIIVLCTTTNTIGLQCLREAQNHAIKVAVLDAIISVEEAKKSGIDLSFSVGTNNVMIGEQAAKFVTNQNKWPVPKVLVLEGMVGNSASTDRVTGFKKELQKDLPNAKIVNSISADWDRLKALNVTTDTLTRTPDLNVVFAANDMMALGATEAIRVRGKTDKILVVGVDGVADARKAILAGKMTASVAQLPYLIGQRSVDLAKESLRGHCFHKTEKTPLLVLTKDVLESKIDPLLKYVR